MTKGEMSAYLADWVSNWPSQSEAARQLGISRSHLSHMLARRKPVGDHVAAMLGYRVIVSYELKRKTVEANTDATCAHCRLPQSKHYATNFADGPAISGPTLVCPNATYQEQL